MSNVPDVDRLDDLMASLKAQPDFQRATMRRVVAFMGRRDLDAVLMSMTDHEILMLRRQESLGFYGFLAHDRR